MTLIQTDGRSKRYALLSGGECVASGELCGTDYLATSLTVVADEDENAFVQQLPADAFPVLPDSGWLEAGDIYSYGGGAVIVRQSHNRTEHDPADVPALFIVYRADASGVLDWVAGEQVQVGTHRLYGGTEYECIQSHVTQADWVPDATPALWREYIEPQPSAEWQPWTAYAIGDVVTYGGAEYECRQSHTSQPGWEPPNVLALWLPL